MHEIAFHGRSGSESPGGRGVGGGVETSQPRVAVRAHAGKYIASRNMPQAAA